MCRFGEAVERFIPLVLAQESELREEKSFSRLLDKLYELYHQETEKVATSKSKAQFTECMKNLIILHRDTGGRVEQKNGFYEFWTNHGLANKLDQAADPYRVYVNASTKNVIVLGRILIKVACLDAKAVYFKIADDAAAVDKRKDAIVIYTFGKENARALANQLGTITGEKLTPSVPGLTSKVAPGISVAADPKWVKKDQVSFGMHRVRPFATAMVCYRDEVIPLLQSMFRERQTVEVETRAKVFRVLVAGAFKAHAIDPNEPASVGTDEEVSKRANTVAEKVEIPIHYKMKAVNLLRPGKN